jgi:hypothetical protein
VSRRPPRVPRPKPYARDMGQRYLNWARRWDAIGTSNVAKACEPQETAATATLVRDSVWDTAETADMGECPKKPVPLYPVGQPARAPWTVPEWLGFHEERRAIRQFDGGQPEALAARGAWLDTVALWLERHPVCPVAKLVWDSELLRLARIAESVEALAALGIREPPPPPRP